MDHGEGEREVIAFVQRSDARDLKWHARATREVASHWTPDDGRIDAAIGNGINHLALRASVV